MTTLQQIATVLIAGAATVLTRFLPFFAFRHGAPRFIRYLGDVLPGAIFGMLVIYCLKDVDVLAGSNGHPRRSASLSPAASTSGAATCCGRSSPAPPPTCSS